MADPTVVAFPADERTAAPAHLSADEAAVWRAVIGSRKAGHFRPEIFPLLEQYCATAMMSDHVAARLRAEDGIDHALIETSGKLTDTLVDLAEALGLLPGGNRARDVGA